jgi:hypothetical protein
MSILEMKSACKLPLYHILLEFIEDFAVLLFTSPWQSPETTISVERFSNMVPT